MHLGIEIGGTKLQLVLGAADGTIARRERCLVDPSRGGEGIRTQIRQAIPRLGSGAKIRACAVGFGGPVDCQTGKICCSHHVEGWADFELGKWLSDLTQAPVRIENDANTGGLGEAIVGAGKGKNPVFYVTLGSGVGGGLVVNGVIYHGAIPGEAEIGHIRLDRNGTIVEERCAGWSVDRRIRELSDANPSSALAKLSHGARSGEARFLAEAVRLDDPVAKNLLKEIGEDLGFALSHVDHLCHPETIVLGGGLSLVGELLRQSVESGLERFVMKAFKPAPTIALAALGEDAVPVGALLLAGQIGSL